MSRWSFLGTKGCSKNSRLQFMDDTDEDGQWRWKNTEMHSMISGTYCVPLETLSWILQSRPDLSAAMIRVEPGWVTLLKFPHASRQYIRLELCLSRDKLGCVFFFPEIEPSKKVHTPHSPQIHESPCGALFQIYSGNPGDETLWLESKTGQAKGIRL